MYCIPSIVVSVVFTYALVYTKSEILGPGNIAFIHIATLFTL